MVFIIKLKTSRSLYRDRHVLLNLIGLCQPNCQGTEPMLKHFGTVTVAKTLGTGGYFTNTNECQVYIQLNRLCRPYSASGINLDYDMTLTLTSKKLKLSKSQSQLVDNSFVHLQFKLHWNLELPLVININNKIFLHGFKFSIFKPRLISNGDIMFIAEMAVAAVWNKDK